jgi:hypothetical protein
MKIILAFLTLISCYASFAQFDTSRDIVRANSFFNKITMQVSNASCYIDKPNRADFITKFRSISGTATLLPQGVARVIRPTLELLSDDRISELRIQITGRRNNLENLQNCVLQTSEFSGNFSDLQTIAGSDIKIFRAYAWRDYSPVDLAQRIELCEERIRILMKQGVNNALATRSFQNFERDMGVMVNEGNPGHGELKINPKDLENMARQSVSDFERDFSRAHSQGNDDNKLFEIEKKIREIDDKYKIKKDTVFCRDFVTTRLFVPGSQIRKIRFKTVQGNIASGILLLSVTKAPKVLMCFAQGGACGLFLGCDNGTGEDPLITTDAQACQGIGRSAALFSPQVTQRGCNDMCCDTCTNFLALLAKTLSDHKLANTVRGINNDGNATCNIASSEEGINNEIVIGWWRNTTEEWVCSTQVVFNDIISHFRDDGNTHLILLGQSHGGKKLTDMVNNWPWGNGLKLDLLVLWDATSLAGAVQSVGSRPKFVLNFFQKNGLSPQSFQEGDHVAEANEEYDFSGCVSHDALARSIFVHSKTEETIANVITNIRNNARPGTD